MPETHYAGECCRSKDYSQLVQKLYILTARSFPCRQARQIQASLHSLAERFEQVMLDHSKLEKENDFLVRYMCTLTGEHVRKTSTERHNGGRGTTRNVSRRTSAQSVEMKNK